MFKRIIPVALSLFILNILSAQNVRKVLFETPPGHSSQATQRVPCDQNTLGTTTLGTLSNQSQSNSIPTLQDITYLCAGDEFNVFHGGEQLNGDPDPATNGGVGYAVYFGGEPTIDGPDITTILGDQWLLGAPTTSDQVIIAAGPGAPNTNDITFSNTTNPSIGGTFQEVFNSGNPIQLWFAPITYDAIDGNGNIVFEGDPSGPCVSVGLEDRFSVVYLNPIEIASQVYPFGGNNSEARLNITGGFPEFDQGEVYNIIVRNTNDPSIVGAVTNGSHGHGGFPTIKVPQPGEYEITITDALGCSSTTTTINFQNFQNGNVVFESSGGTYTIGQEVCVDITTSEFENLVAFYFALNWDTSLLEFNRLDFDGAFLNAGDVNIFTDSIGYASVSFFDLGLNGNTLPDDTRLFTICYLAKAEGNTSVTFENDPRYPLNGPRIEAIDEPGNEIPTTLLPGTITIVNPNSVTVTFNEIKDACPGENNGSLELTAVGGEPPYEISLVGPTIDGPLMNVQSGDIITFDNLMPGDYQILVRSSNNDLKIEDISVVEANLAVNANMISSPICNGDSNGVMIAEVALNGVVINDLTGYSFIWTNIAGDTISNEETANGLASGNYTVFAMNNNGCTVDDSGNLTQPAAMTAAPNAVQPSCSGVADGAIQIPAANITGGNGSYTFNWSNGVTGESNLNITSGLYEYTITDAGGCELTDAIQLEAQTEILINVSLNQVQCFGLDNGNISVTAGITGIQIPNGGGTYTFDWSPNTQNIDNSVFNSSFADNLAPDTYSVTLTNSELPGCEAVSTIEITQPDSLRIEIDNISNVSSCTVDDGAVSLRVEGGIVVNDYTYLWEGGQTTNQVSNLAADTFTVYVTDDNACLDSLDVVVGTPPPPVVQFFDNDSVDCATDLAFLQVIASSGRPGVNISQYMWSHDPNLNDERAPNLTPGIYYVTIVDEDQCATLDSALVYAPPAITVDTTILTAPCFEAEDGRISVTVSGGTPDAGQPYRIEWSNGFANSVLANIPSGDYGLRVIDAKGCNFDTTISLNHLPRILVDFNGITGVDCFDNIDPADCNGQAMALATYEDGSAGSFDFTWNATGESVQGSTQTASSILCAGMQELLVFDGRCQVTETVEIPSPPQLLYDAANSSSNPVTCFGDTDGSASVVATGGTPGYTYAWPGGSTGQNISNLSEGSYTLTITDMNGCVATHDIIINQPDQLMVGLDLDNTNDVICAGEDNGKIQIIVSGGNQGVLSYSWTNSVSNGPSAAGLAPGTYSIQVTDAKNCSNSTEYTVTEPSPISAEINYDPIQCNGFQTTISLSNPQGGNGTDYQFGVDNSPPQPLNAVIPVFGGDHLISIFDATGCQVDENISIPEPAPVVVEFPTSLVEVDLGSSITLEPTISSNVPIADLIWTSNGSPVDSSFICNSILCDQPTVNPLENISYTLEVTDQNGCFAQNSVLVEVDKNRNVYIPNVFAPNNTGFDTNDRFEIFTGSGVQKINFARVFNRWGTMVAEVNNIDPSNAGIVIWDGFVKGQKANQGVYIYLIEVEFIDRQPTGENTKLLYRGDVTLLR